MNANDQQMSANALANFQLNQKAYESPLSKAKRHIREVDQRLTDLVNYREQVEQRILADKRELAQIDEVIGLLANAPAAVRVESDG